MKIKISKTTTNEIEIKLPFFGKTDAGYAAILSDTQAIMLWEFPTLNGWSIGKRHPEKVYKEIKSEINHEEFITAYSKIVDDITDDMDHNMAAINLICDGNKADAEDLHSDHQQTV